MPNFNIPKYPRGKATGEFTPSVDLERNEPLPCRTVCNPSGWLPRPVGPNEQFTASLFLNTHRAKAIKEMTGNELGHSTIGKFIPIIIGAGST